MLSAEVVEGDVLWGYSPVVAHLEDGLVHERRTTEVELDVFRCFVFAQVLIDHSLMYKAEESVAFLVVDFLLPSQSCCCILGRIVLYRVLRYVEHCFLVLRRHFTSWSNHFCLAENQFALSDYTGD